MSYERGLTFKWLKRVTYSVFPFCRAIFPSVCHAFFLLFVAHSFFCLSRILSSPPRHKYFHSCSSRTLFSLCWKYFVKDQNSFLVRIGSQFIFLLLFSSFSMAMKLKGLFVLFAGYLVKNCASLLDAANISKTGKVPL